MDTSRITPIEGFALARKLLNFDFKVDDVVREELRKRPQAWHHKRGKLILEAHPELKQYCQPSMLEGLVLAIHIAVHLGFALFVAPLLPWWALMIAIYVLGAILCFNIFLFSHDVGHRAVVKNIVAVRILQFVISSTLWAPATMIFGPHHLHHHATLGTEDDDDSLVFTTFTNTPDFFCTPFRRMLYLSVAIPLRSIIEPAVVMCVRVITFFVKGPKEFDFLRSLSFTKPISMLYALIDCLATYVVFGWAFHYAGWKALAYLWLSNSCAFGFGCNHVVGWFMLQHLDRFNTDSKEKVLDWTKKRLEHYAKPPKAPETIAKLGVSDAEWNYLSKPLIQPTCSVKASQLYNFLFMNAGLHTEHHDLPQVPCIYLHKIKAGAPEFYDELWGPSSLWQVVSDFIWDSKDTMYSDFGSMEFRHKFTSETPTKKLD